jgi:chromosome segregation ATPase
MSEYLREDDPQKTRKFDWKFPVMFGVVLALAAVSCFAIWSNVQLEHQVNQLRAALETQLTDMNTAAQEVGKQNTSAVDALRSELDEVRKQASTAAGRAKTAADKRAQDLVNKLAEEHRKQREQVDSELGVLKQSASSANEKVANVASDVTAVRSDIDRTKSDLDATRSDLKSVRGDLGVQSGLIATNSRELAALRELGERNYYEFDVPKSKLPMKIANISMVLRKADPKRSRYTLDVVADDRRIEKKDKYINEPVQFYVARSRAPYEVVVNEVKKDRIIGYLAIPKVLETARR